MNIRVFHLSLFNSILKKIFFCLTFILGIVFILAIIGRYLYFYYLIPPKDFPLNTIISIKKGQSAKKVAFDFYHKHLIRSPFLFETLLWLFKEEGEIKAGEYFFEKPLLMTDLLKDITANTQKGKFLKFTIPEGFTLHNIGLMGEDLGLWKKEDFWNLAGFSAFDCLKIKGRNGFCPGDSNKFKEKFSFLKSKPDYASLEGYLFPDTYYLPLDISPNSLIEIMLKNFGQKVNSSILQSVQESGHSLFEVLTMASLLEKEASSEKDRRLIAGILWKRLKKGMLLQVDAIFPYIIGKNSFELTINDLRYKSPYNTYLSKGLPPTPVANPGLASIKAALNPLKSPYWYYLSDRKGKIHYSITYKEHLKKKRKYLRHSYNLSEIMLK